MKNGAAVSMSGARHATTGISTTVAELKLSLRRHFCAVLMWLDCGI